MSSAAPASAPLPTSAEAMWRYAWTVREFTASDAIAATGLTRSTVIEALDGLVARGLLRELPNARNAGEYRKGRPARRFELRDDVGVLIGVDAGRAHVTVVMTDLRSREIVARRVDADALSEDVDVRRRLLTDAVDDTLAAADRGRADVLAIAVGVPAPVDARGASPRHPDGFWDLMNPGLVDLFGWAPLVRIDNDASLAAEAEGAVGAAIGCRDYVTLLAGERLGAGVVVDARILRGAHGGVGEMIALDHVEGVGSAYGLGHVAAQWARDEMAGGTIAHDSSIGRLGDDLDGKHVLALAEAGDADAARIVDRLGARLARIVVVLGSVFDPSRIVISGAVAEGAGLVVTAARAHLPTDLHMPAPEIVASTLGAGVVVIGAVAAAASLTRERLLGVYSGSTPRAPGLR